MAEKEPERWVIINADRPKEAVHEEVVSVLTEKLKQNGMK